MKYFLLGLYRIIIFIIFTPISFLILVLGNIVAAISYAGGDICAFEDVNNFYLRLWKIVLRCEIAEPNYDALELKESKPRTYLKEVCPCKKEWLFRKIIPNAYPYGDFVRYDICTKCGKKHNFKVS